MKIKVFKRSVSVLLALVIMLSLSSMAFAAEKTTTATYGSDTLTSYLAYWGAESQQAASGEISLDVTWSGSAVGSMWATVEVVDYYTGESLKTISNNASNTTRVSTFSWNSILDTRRVTVFGCAEIRDPFSLTSYPTIYGTYGRSDGTR